MRPIPTLFFPDLDLLPVREEDGRLYAPGIGDDTANLVNLLLAARYLIARQVPLRCGVLIVANACEEGLGNLDGTKALFAACGTRVRGYYSFDMYMPSCCTRAVGSWRYRITCRTAGGHSYQDFGRPSASGCSAAWRTSSTASSRLPGSPTTSAASKGAQPSTPSRRRLHAL